MKFDGFENYRVGFEILNTMWHLRGPCDGSRSTSGKHLVCHFIKPKVLMVLFNAFNVSMLCYLISTLDDFISL